MPRIRPVKNLREYFMRSVAASLQRNDVEVDEHTSCYVVDLLTVYARSEALFDEGENGPELKPVALLLAEAVDGSREERNRALRRVGDQSLFIAGFLAESLKNRVVDVDYYVSMGGSAYATLSSATHQSYRDLALGPVFAELAENFVDFVDVITDLCRRACDEPDMLRLYETWVRTGSRRAARLLRSHGVEPQQDLRRRRKPH
ncbi:MAG TPA: hypothetical protein VMR74_10725 [Gammaproteobacteria bacterium]|nr:hypothetical protein [Gammaproteobacteria bacterium]